MGPIIQNNDNEDVAGGFPEDVFPEDIFPPDVFPEDVFPRPRHKNEDIDER